MIDSIAAHFRHGFQDMSKRSRTLNILSQNLIRIATSHRIAVSNILFVCMQYSIEMCKLTYCYYYAIHGLMNEHANVLSYAIHGLMNEHANVLTYAIHGLMNEHANVLSNAIHGLMNEHANVLSYAIHGWMNEQANVHVHVYTNYPLMPSTAVRFAS